MAEIKGGLRYRVDGLERIRATYLPNGSLVPQDPIATSPNRTVIPDFTLDQEEVVARIDGRFYTHDPTLWPQFYFEGTWYYPYILVRPDDFDMDAHPHRLAWYTLTDDDLVLDSDPLGLMVLIKTTMVEQFDACAYALSEKARRLKHLQPEFPSQFRDMEHCRIGMMNAVAILGCAPQTRHDTLMTVASFQRYYLECLACVDYFTIWVPRIGDGDGVAIRPVDTSVMGAVTPNLAEAQKLYQQGVSVWLIRPPNKLLPDMKVVEQVTPLSSLVAPQHFEKTIHPGTRAVMCSPPSAARNRACQANRIGGINLGHSADERQLGDVHQPTFLRTYLMADIWI